MSTKRDDHRLSLHGLTPEEALRALLAVDPDALPVEPDERLEDAPDPDRLSDERPRRGEATR